MHGINKATLWYKATELENRDACAGKKERLDRKAGWSWGERRG